MMLTGWFIVLFASFCVSVLMMTNIQIRGAAQYGWFGLRQRPFLDTYWRELSHLERWLLWPGLVAFGATLAVLALWKIATWLG